MYHFFVSLGRNISTRPHSKPMVYFIPRESTMNTFQKRCLLVCAFPVILRSTENQKGVKGPEGE